MNLATILTAIPVAALIVWALVKTVRSRGRCSGCRGFCSLCRGCGGQGDGTGGRFSCKRLFLHENRPPVAEKPTIK